MKTWEYLVLLPLPFTTNANFRESIFLAESKDFGVVARADTCHVEDTFNLFQTEFSFNSMQEKWSRPYSTLILWGRSLIIGGITSQNFLPHNPLFLVNSPQRWCLSPKFFLKLFAWTTTSEWMITGTERKYEQQINFFWRVVFHGRCSLKLKALSVCVCGGGETEYSNQIM